MTDMQYSEMFLSMQGEGSYNGRIGPWLRFALCNLQCDGFGQEDPTDPSTYELPYEDIDLSGIDRIEDLPVFEKGCDSSYTWAKKFKCLMKNESAEDVAQKITDLMKNEFNPEGFFKHPKTGVEQHMHFTGGEPLLKRSQAGIIGIMNEFRSRQNSPHYITIETNGTQPLGAEFIDFFSNRGMFHGELFFSVSPKLFTVSGEKAYKAIKPVVVSRYFNMPGSKGQLKFVVDGTDRCWEELKHVVQLYREVGINWPIFVMPVGARVEQQDQTAGDIANEAIKRGYNVAVRSHCNLWGNAIGT